MLGDLLRKGVATGLGLMWITKERAEDIVSDWVRQGKITLEQSRDMAEKLLKEAEEQRDELYKLVSVQVDKAIQAAGLAKQSDLKALEERIATLEQRCQEGDQESRP